MKSILFFAFCFLFMQGVAQVQIDVPAYPQQNDSNKKTVGIKTQYQANGDNYGGGLKINFDKDGNKYLRFLFINQTWLRYIEQNPGTMVNGNPVSNSLDIGLRRVRLVAYAQIGHRFLVLTHIGINNQSFTNGGAVSTVGTGGYGAGKKPGLFVHEAIAEIAIVPTFNIKKQKNNKGSLYIGGGLHYWNGLSRMTSAGTLNILTVDVPVFNWPLIENSDQFARQLGIYLKGEIYKLNYRFSVNKPFATNLTPPPYSATKGSIAVDNNGVSKVAVQGYVDYQFFEQESNLLPYKAGTYIGTKKLLNIGFGFYHQSEGTRSFDASGNIRKHDINLLGADVFLDMPVGLKKWNMAITAYSVFYKYLFGPNYTRNIGILNIANGVDTTVSPANRPIQGIGNNRVLIGTGNIWYTQAGFLLPNFSDKIRLQPFAAYALQNFEFLDSFGHNVDVGVNIFVHGHNAKITPQYSLRPLFFDRDGKNLSNGYKGELILQLQVSL